MKRRNSLSTVARSSFLPAIVLLFTNLCFAQGLQKGLGAEGYEKGSCIKQLSNGFIIGGELQGQGLNETDALLTRTDANGNVLWTKTYGGPEREVINDVMQTADNGFLFLAERYQPDKKEGEFLMLGKTDAQGNLLWKKIFEEGGNETEGFSMSSTPDGHYIITGVTRKLNVVSTAFYNVADRDPRLYMLKVDSSGNKIWSRALTIPNARFSTTGNSVIVAKDGSYIIAGNITKKIENAGEGEDNEQEARNMLLIKVKPDGSLAWAKEYSAYRITAGFRVIEKEEGGFIVVGIATPDNTNNVDFCMVSLSTDGSLLWAKTIGGQKFDPVSDVVQTTDGGFVVSGSTSSFGSGASDILMLKTNNTGTLQWAKTYGGISGEYAAQLIAVPGGFALTGQASIGKDSYDVLLLKTDEKGNSGCWGNSIAITMQPFYVTGSTITNAATTGVEASDQNYKKPDLNNITQQVKEARSKDICQ